MEVMPSLRLPYEKNGLYHEGIKLYKNVRPYMIEKCNERRAKTYYCRKYHWTPDQFRSINWDALPDAMKRYNQSTSKWISKFSRGFVGTAKTLSRREYWLNSNCPLCNVMEEDNTNIICCPHPPHRERIEQSLQDVYEWLEYINSPPLLLAEIQRINRIWMEDQTLLHTTSSIPSIQSQLDIGWSHLFYGRITNDMATEIQCQYTRKRSMRTS